ncbi:Retinoblastoma-binding protein [Coemansia sp. IMI 209127]|nr:Retinoblastoma-binding protein [Coemansia sp. IMI 209127]
MSQIQYKFRSSKDYSTVIFDGLSLSVDDLKQEILREQKLDPDEFDLVITNEQTNEDYKSDAILIPKNTMVLVRRIPFTGTRMPRTSGSVQQQQQQQPQSHQQGYGNRGGGFYRNYNANGPPPRSTQYGYRGPQGIGLNSNKPGDSGTDQEVMDDVTGIADDAEDARIAAMLQQSTEQWSHQQSMMEMQRRTGAYRPRPHMVRPERQGPPPQNYVCHRCGTQGHWIDKCPTLSQVTDGTGRPPAPRIKRTTGIPRSFLQKVDNLDDVGNALVTSDGTLVVATANKAAWDHAQRLTGGAIASADAVDASQVPDGLKCYICRNLARDAVTTPCCKTVFCSACIENALLQTGDMRFTCPDCNTKGVVPDQLETASEVRGKVDEFLREYSAKRHDAQDADKPADAGDTKDAGDTPLPEQAKPNGNVVVVSRPPVQMQPRPRVPHQNMGMMHPHGMMMGMGPGFPGMPMGMPMGMPPYMPPGMVPPYPQLPGMPPGAGAPWGAGMPPPPQQQQPRNDDKSPSRNSTRRSRRGPDNDSDRVPTDDEAPISGGSGSTGNRRHSPVADRRQSNGRSRSRYDARDSQGDRTPTDRDSHRSSRHRRDSIRSRSRDGGDDRRRRPDDDGRRLRGDGRHSGRSDDRYRGRGRDESRHRNEERSQRREEDGSNRDARSESRSQSSAAVGGSASSRRRRRRERASRSRSPATRADSKVVQLTIRGKSSDAGSAGGKGQRSVFDRIRDDRSETQGGTRDANKGESDKQKSSGGGRRRRNRR